MAESSYMIAPGETTDSMSMKRKLALALAQKNLKPLQVDHWAQGLAHLGDQAYSGYEIGKLNRDEKEETAKGNALLAQMLGNPSAAPTSSPIPNGKASEVQIMPADQFNSIDAMADLKPETQAKMAAAQGAVAGIESGGRYDEMGPVVNSGSMAGQRGVGKYQVMEGNVGPWSKEVMGRALTPQQFAANPDAQDAVFNGKFGGMMDKYGAAGAARAWHAGPGGMNNPNAQDQLGTKTADYGRRVAAALEGDGAVLPAGARPAQSQQPGTPSREMLIQMLGNRKTAPIAQAIISTQIQQRFKPSEYDFKERPDGTLVAVNKKNPSDMQVVNAPGSGQSAIDYEANKAAAIATAKGKAEKLVGKEDRDKEQRQVGNVVIQDIDRTLEKITASPKTTTGPLGAVLENIPGFDAHNVGKLIETVKANAGFAELQKMRNNSPTGGALGQVSEREIAYLQSTIGNLAVSQDATQLQDNLRRVKNAYIDIVHGDGKGPPREKLSFDGGKVRKFNPATGKIE